MKEFLDSLRVASNAMLEMVNRWENLNEFENDKVQELKQWGEGFNVSLDEIPLILWSALEELERGES